MNKKKILVLVAVVLLVGFVGYLRFNTSNNKKVAKDGGLIDQYNAQLNGLKDQAKSGKAEDLQNYGIAQYATGDYSGAIKTYQKQIEVDPNNVLAHSGLANALRDDKQYTEAIAQYNKVIELDPTKVTAYVNLASVYQYSLKQMSDAVATYERGIKATKSTDLYLLLAMAYEQSGDMANAKATYSKALELNPGNVVAKTALERLGK